MPINVFGNSSSSYDNGKKIETSLFVQKLYLRSKYFQASIEKNIDLKNQHRIKKLPDPICLRELCSRSSTDNKFNDPTIIKNTAQVDFNDKNLNNVYSIKVNSIATLEEHLTPKYYVDNSLFKGIEESSLLRLDLDEKVEIDEQEFLILNSTLTLPKTVKKIAYKITC